MSRRVLAFLAPALALVALICVGVGTAQDPGKKAKPDSAAEKSAPSTAPKASVKEPAEPHNKNDLALIDELRKQLAEKTPPVSICKLVGQLEPDAFILQAEFKFETSVPRAVVFLGLKNAFLTDEGKLDDGLPNLESADDGFTVRVERVGEHRLVLNFRVLVTGKRPGTTGNERGIELGLPGAAVTTLALGLAPNVKELKAAVSTTSLAAIPQTKDFRWTDLPGVLKSPTQWELTIGAQKSLSLGWKEAVNAAVSVQPPSAKANVTVKLEELRLIFTGNLVLEDPRSQLREWTLTLPTGVKLDSAPGTSVDAKGNTHTVKLTDPVEKLTLGIQGQVPRTQPQQRLPIGPFLVQGAAVESTITVQEVAGVTVGQRLVYYPFGECYQRDVPPLAGPIRNLAQFKAYNTTATAKGLPPSKANLELEWKTEKGQIDATTEHDVKFRRDRDDWIVEVETRFKLNSSSSGQDAVDLIGPAPTWPDLLGLAVAPGQPFPATLRWIESSSPRLPSSVPGISILSRDTVKEIEGPLPDSPRHWRIRMPQAIGKEIVLRIETRAVLPGDASRFTIDLPRLTGVLDKGGRIVVTKPHGQDLFVGPIGQEEQPVRDKFTQSFDQMPTGLELAWRPGGRERYAQALVDVQVREHALSVRQHLTLAAEDWSDKEFEERQIPLVISGPIPLLPEAYGKPERGRIWVQRPGAAAGKLELDLAFDVPLDKAVRDGKTPIRIPLLWPEGTNRKDAKVRLWTEPSVFPTLEGLGKSWIEGDLEHVPGKSSFPALVATGQGADLALAIRLEESDGGKLPALVAQRTLAQVRIGPDGGQSVQLRFLVKRFGGTSIDFDLPVPRNQAQPVVKVAGLRIDRIETVDAARNRIRVPLAPQLYPTPVLFEISYLAPAESVEGRRWWQTPIALPKFHGDVFFGPTRLQLGLPNGQVPLVLGNADVDYRWATQGWLLGPEPSVTTADLDAWIGQGEAAERQPVSLAWWRSGLGPERIYHFPRQSWLLLCSGIVNLVGLALLLVRWSRWLLAIVLVALGAGIVAVGISHDYVLPVIFFGCQPALLVLVIVGGIRWLLHERYRRQLVFMPTFARIPQGSTLVRGQAPKPREASTIDAPPGLMQQTSSRGSGK